MTKIIRLIVAEFPRKPATYFFLFTIWVSILWFLSAGNPGPKNGPEIPHFDKFCHFSYFLIGGALLMQGAWLKWPDVKKAKLFLTTLIIGSIIGALDEYHQTFTPGRSGNDVGDWLADSLGMAAGSALLIWLVLPHFSVILKNNDLKSD